MELKQLTKERARIILCSIKERLAAIAFSYKFDYIIKNMSSHNTFESWDIVWDKDLTPELCEIKVRNRNSTDFKDSWIFEKKKYKTLMDGCSGPEAIRIGLQPRFVCFFKDKVCIWDITRIKPQDFVIDAYRASSMNCTEKVVDKEICYLSIDNAINIDYQLPIDEITSEAKIIFKYEYPTSTHYIKNI